MGIFLAVERKNLRELKRILKRDPLAARRPDCWRRTAQMVACVEGEDAFVRLLLPVSDPKASDRDGATALIDGGLGRLTVTTDFPPNRICSGSVC